MHFLSPMKSLNVRFICWNLVLCLLSLGLAGCETPNYQAEMEAPSPEATGIGLAKLVIGDTVTVTFSGDITDLPQPQKKPIKDDGTITLPDKTTISREEQCLLKNSRRVWASIARSR